MILTTLIIQTSLFVAGFETFKPCPHKDNTQYSRGFGMRTTSNARCVTLPEALQHLQTEVLKLLVDTKEQFPHLNNEQLMAIVSFEYNIGVTAFANSSLHATLKDPACRVTVRCNNIIKKNFKKFIYSAGKKLGGLVKRRNMEADLFIGTLRVRE